MSGVLSLNAKPGALGALWAASQDIPQLLFWDDWQFRAQISHMRTLSTHAHYLSKPFGNGLYYDSDPQEAILASADVILGTAAELSQTWTAEHRLSLCPMYTWGNHAMVLHDIPCPRERITFVDPSPFILDEVFELMQRDPMPPRTPREWTLPSLMPHGEWVERQNLAWPVTYFGSKKMGAERLRTEAEIVLQVASRDGVLSPKYHHGGSGWWRSRFIYAAATGTVLAGDPQEAAALGSAYTIPPVGVEEMTADELHALAETQAEVLFPTLWTRERWTEAVNDLPRWLNL